MSEKCSPYDNQLVQIMERRIAEKDAEIERLADVAETNTAAYEYAVVERDEARAALADVTRERDDLRARVNKANHVIDRFAEPHTVSDPGVALIRITAALLDTTTADEE